MDIFWSTIGFFSKGIYTEVVEVTACVLLFISATEKAKSIRMLQQQQQQQQQRRHLWTEAVHCCGDWPEPAWIAGDSWCHAHC